MVQPHRRDAQQLGGDACEAAREREPSDRRVLPPDVADLDEGLAVRVALVEGPLLDGVAERGLTDQRSVGGDLVGRGDVAQQHVPVTLEIAARIAAQRVWGIEAGRPGGRVPLVSSKSSRSGRTTESCLFVHARGCRRCLRVTPYSIRRPARRPASFDCPSASASAMASSTALQLVKRGFLLPAARSARTRLRPRSRRATLGAGGPGRRAPSVVG